MKPKAWMLIVFLAVGLAFATGYLAGMRTGKRAAGEPLLRLRPVDQTRTKLERATRRLALLDNEIARLATRLAGLESRYEDQKALIQALSSMVADAAGHGDADAVVEEMVRSQILRMGLNEHEILGLVSGISHIPIEDMPQNVSPEDFAVRLAQVAARGVLTPLDSNSKSASVSFDFAVNEDHSLVQPRTEFLPEDKRIYAAFSTEDFGHDSVFVKWMRKKPPAVLLMNTYPVDPESPVNYVWMEQKNGWKPGDYVVEIYAPQNNMELLARGEYHVSATPE